MARAEMQWALHTGWTRAEFRSLTELALTRANRAAQTIGRGES